MSIWSIFIQSLLLFFQWVHQIGVFVSLVFLSTTGCMSIWKFDPTRNILFCYFSQSGSLFKPLLLSSGFSEKKSSKEISQVFVFLFFNALMHICVCSYAQCLCCFFLCQNWKLNPILMVNSNNFHPLLFK